jgi:hypothetical protein
MYDEKITNADVATERVFADAGTDDADVAKSILAGDVSSEVVKKEKVPVLAVATWTPAPAAEFVSASGDKAIFKISMAKYLSSNADIAYNVKYTILTAKQTNQALSNPVFVEKLTFNGNYLDAARVSANIEVARGERTLVQVRVSEYDGLDMIKQSAAEQIAAALTVVGKDAYSGLTIMSNAEQSAVAFPVTDVRSVLNFAATDATASTCLADIALESKGIQDAKMVFNHLGANWSKATKIYLLNADGTKTVQDATLRSGEFTVTGQDPRNFDVFALEDLKAMKSYSYEIHRHWTKLISGSVANNDAVYETLYDAAPITVTIVPTIAVQNRAVKFFAADGLLNSAFEFSGVTEVNGEDQMKAIKALGGVFNAVLMKNAAGKYDELDKSSSARFASVVTKKGIHFLASCAQYLNPNFGALYSIDNQYVKSAQTTDVQVYFGAVPATLSPVTVTSDKDGCLVSWPELAAGRSVDVYAHFDDVSFADKDVWEKLNTDNDGAALTANKFLIAHADLRVALGLTYAQYFSGITFMVVQKDAAAGESLPAAIFHMPVGKTSFAAGDFTVASGAKQLTIKYNKMGELNKELMSEDFAGNSLIPATITYTDNNSIIATLRVADITSANGVVISGLDDAKTYAIKIAIDGQKNDDLVLSGDHSPAAAPAAVSDLKVTIASVSSLKVEFAAASSNGEYNAPAYKAYVSRDVTGGKVYLSVATGTEGTIADGRTGIDIVSGATLTGLIAGAEYTVEIESKFAAKDNNSEQKVSAFASATPCALPVMKDFRLNAKNKTATMIVDLQGAKLNTLLLLTNTGSVLNIALANAAVAQSVAISKRSNLALNISLPEGVTGAVGIIANSQGAALNGAPTNAQGFATTNDQTGLYDAVTAWTNL